MVRFGDWQAVLDEPRPTKQAKFMNGVWRYARGLALVHTDRIKAAKKEARALDKILAEPGIYDYPASLNGAGRLLSIAADILGGEIAAAKGDYDTAIARMQRAVRLQDGLLYMEPPDWFFPSRHYLGAVLLEAGLPAQAETVYWADLRRNPNNGFALFGLTQALEAQGNERSASEVKARFSKAWSAADHQLLNSRY
jgi:tetratricopeptide (TPR) repeat protein